jgi:hypothetical protein
LEDILIAISFYGPYLGHILKEEYRKAVIEQYKKTSRADKPINSDFLGMPSVSLEEKRIALAKLEEKKRLKKGGKVPYGDSRIKVCECSTCLRSDKFDINMGRGGPESLCTYNLDVSELLKLLGADTEENLAIVEELCALSVAAMDIESMTLDVHMEPPARQGSGLFYGIIDEAKLQGHFKKVQKPVMIAHLDQVEKNVDNDDDDDDDDDEDDDSQKELSKIKVFTIESDAEESIYSMMRAYWKHVKKQHNSAKKQKFRLAQPLFDLIAKYKNAHFEFCNAWCEENKVEIVSRSITRSYCQSLVGQLEKKIMKLIYEYTIFSFYG